MRKGFAIVIGVAAAGVMALGAQTTTAAPDVKYDTEAWLRIHNHERFVYWVHSGGGKRCERGRLVTLFKQRPGPDRKLDTARSEYRSGPHRGLAVLTASLTHTVVYTKVRREVHDEFVCLGDRSEVHDDGRP